MDQTLKEKPKIKLKVKPPCDSTGIHQVPDQVQNPKKKIILKKNTHDSKGEKSKEKKKTKGKPNGGHRSFFSPKEKPNFMTVKTSLKSILKNHQTSQPVINDLVISCHQIVIRTYQLMRLYLLCRYNQVKEQIRLDPSRRPPMTLFPTVIKMEKGHRVYSTEIDVDLIRYFIRAGGIVGNTGPEVSNPYIADELEEFYQKEYQPCLGKEKYDLRNKTFIIDKLAQQIQTGYNNNIKVHFLTRIRRLMNILNPMTPKEKGEKEKKRLFGRIKNAILMNCHQDIPVEYQEWSQMIREEYLPRTYEKCYGYDVHVHPEKYIYYLIKMNEKIEQTNQQINDSELSTEEKRKQTNRLFQPIPLRTSIIPCYFPIDVAVINSYFLKKTGRSGLQKQLKENRSKIWDVLFHTDRRVMRKTGYVFKSIQTDGVGVSICFQREGHRSNDENNMMESDDSEIYISDLTEREIHECIGKKLIGSDPGKEDLTHLMDDRKRRLRYGTTQRRVESQAERNREILLIEKNRHHITAEESVLTKSSCRTVDYQKFKDYIHLKTTLDEKIGWFYQQELYRKMKWRTSIDRRKSEDRFLNRIEQTYGPPEEIVICHGNWSQGKQMKHLYPSLGIGMRRLLRRRYKVLLVDEWGTSKYCNQCHAELIHHHSSETNKDLYRVLRCSNCERGSSESKRTYFFNRDSNACMNILYLCHEWLENRRRPSPYNRNNDADHS